MSPLSGKILILTGASEGIGAALVNSLRARGALLVMVARNEARLRQNATAQDFVLVGDLTSEAFREAIVEKTLTRFGRIDGLINNAGRGSYFSSTGTPLAEARSLFELNFFAPFHLTQLVAPHVGATQGTIVNVSSIAGQIPLPWLPLYSATKFALASLTSTLRVELRGAGVHVMGVFPGYVDTKFQANAAGSAPPDGVVKGKKYAVTAHQCAEAIVEGMEKRRHTVVTPRAGVVPVIVARLFPAFFESKFKAS